MAKQRRPSRSASRKPNAALDVPIVSDGSIDRMAAFWCAACAANDEVRTAELIEAGNRLLHQILSETYGEFIPRHVGDELLRRIIARTFERLTVACTAS